MDSVIKVRHNLDGKMINSYSYSQVLEASTKYFDGDDFAAKVFVDKYALQTPQGEYLELTPADMHRRLAKEFARIENKYPNPVSEETIFSLLDHFKYIVPQGSPMSAIGNPYQLQSLSNCFVVQGVYSDKLDSYGGIMLADQEIAQIMKRRGGVGLDISGIRPKDVITNNAAKTTDGIGVFMERFSNTCREVAQNGRRGALMITISVNHPEIQTFINIKRDKKKVTGANISIRLNDEFMKAVKNDEEYTLRWPVDLPPEQAKVTKKVRAKEIWDQVIDSAWTSAEPGLLFWDTVKKNTPSDIYAEFGHNSICTNPCFSGDTLIAVADGRNAVSIKQLTDEGKDVPVYSVDKTTGKVSIKMGRHPRITGYNQKLVRVILDDGSHFDVTPDHKCLLRDGTEVLAKDLQPGDSLPRFIKTLEKISELNNDPYFMIYGDTRDYHKDKILEHHLIAKFAFPEKWEEVYNSAKTIGFAKTGGLVVHHKDYNQLNNSPDNLQIMTFREYQQFHAEQNCAGEKNGHYFGFTAEEIEQHALELTKQLNRRFTYQDWIEYASKHGLPQVFSSFRKDQFGSVIQLAKQCAVKLGIEYSDCDPKLIAAYQDMLIQNYDAEIVDNQVLVTKICEVCHSQFQIDHLHRESSICSVECKNFYLNSNQEVKTKRNVSRDVFNENKMQVVKTGQARVYSQLKFDLGRDPMMKEWKTACKLQGIPSRIGKTLKFGYKNFKEVAEAGNNYNHKVVKVEELPGEHTVYNITVDDNHTLAIITNFEKNNIGQGKQTGVYVSNCGEIVLPAYDACRLMCLNLASYVKNPFTKDAVFDFKKFHQHGMIAQRLMDDIIDLEIECVDKILAKVNADPEPLEAKLIELNLWKKIREMNISGRRTGLGITALGDALAMLGIKYGSAESIKMTRKIYRALAVSAHTSSCIMAKERGAFPIFNYKLEKDHEYLNSIFNDCSAEVRKMWKTTGRRNIALTTTAPTGSVSSQTQTTSGIEPVYLLSYVRRKKHNPSDKNARIDFVDAMGDKWQEFTVYHHGVQKWMEVTGEKDITKSPYYGATSNEIDWVASVDLQAAAQESIDHSISKTCNLPENVSRDVVSQVYMRAWESGCFLKDAQVYTKCGLQSIQNIKPGTEVFGADGKLHQVDKVFELPAQERELLTIKSRGMESIKCTAEHPLAVVSISHQRDFKRSQKSFTWKLAKDITKNDYLVSPLLINDQPTINTIRVSDYIKTAHVVKNGKIHLLRKVRKHMDKLQIAPHSVSVPNEIKVNNDFATFLGWFIAAGHYSNGRTIRLNFNMNEDHIARDLSKIIKKVFGLESRIFETNGNNGRSLRLEFNSRIVHDLLFELVGMFAENKHLPPFFLQIDKNVLKTLLRCYYQGDTGVTLSQKLAQELFFAYLSIGGNPCFKHNYTLCYTVNDTSEQKRPVGLIWKNFICHKVTGITSEIISDPVFNFSVKDTDSYIVSGTLVHNCKGFTVYRDKCRDGVLIQKSEPKKTADGRPTEIEMVMAPKRPLELPCEIKKVKIQGEQWTIFVGLFNGKPYEVFGGLSKYVDIPNKYKVGKILKNGKVNDITTYNLVVGDGDEQMLIKDIANVFENANFGAFTRTISLALRHGTPIQYIVEQLQKDKYSDVTSFSKVIARVLKNYILDGTKSTAERQCPNKECPSNVAGAPPSFAYIEKCLSCTNCGYSKCG